MARDDYDDVGPSTTKGKPWGIPTVEGDVHKYYDKTNSTVDYNITPSTTNGLVFTDGTSVGPTPDRRAIQVLTECAELQRRKGQDYNRVPQAEYYPNGLDDIYCMMHQKMIRLKSLMKADGEPNFESMDDTARDLINYTSFFVEWKDGKMDGQK